MASSKKISNKLPKTVPHLPSKKIGVPIVIVLLIIAVATSGYFFFQYRSAQEKMRSELVSAEKEASQLVEEVGKHLLLPAGETPTIATVSDKSKLAGQAFFARAENGDKVLIYTEAKKAVLYRPSIQKIIEVGPVNVDTTQAGTPSAEVAGEEVQKEPAKVVLYNGTTTNALTQRAEAELDSYEQIEVTERLNAENKDYKETLVIDLTGGNSEVIQALIDTLGGKEGELPRDEDKPSGADILVILGEDYANK